jgi:hypothetical protein
MRSLAQRKKLGLDRRPPVFCWMFRAGGTHASASPVAAGSGRWRAEQNSRTHTKRTAASRAGPGNRRVVALRDIARLTHEVPSNSTDHPPMPALHPGGFIRWVKFGWRKWIKFRSALALIANRFVRTALTVFYNELSVGRHMAHLFYPMRSASRCAYIAYLCLVSNGSGYHFATFGVARTGRVEWLVVD